VPAAGIGPSRPLELQPIPVSTTPDAVGAGAAGDDVIGGKGVVVVGSAGTVVIVVVVLDDVVVVEWIASLGFGCAREPQPARIPIASNGAEVAANGAPHFFIIRVCTNRPIRRVSGI
jgi:hypothetical protein